MKKKLFSILLALSVVAMVGCKGNSDSSQSSEDSTTSDTGIGEVVQGVNIVDNGATDYKIVIPVEANDPETTASHELQNFVKESTGATLEIISEAQTIYSAAAKYLSIGNTNMAEEYVEYDVSTLKTGGFVIETHGNSVFFLGENMDGTLYSVYDFLEKIVGVRFLTNECTYVPEMKDIPLYDFSIVEEPAIERRYYFAGNESSDKVKEAQFFARNRMASEYGVGSAYGEGTNWCVAAGTSHNIMTHYLIPEKYQAEHPEWFYQSALLDICWTNGLTAEGEMDETMDESVFKVALETMKKYVAESSETTDLFMFGHADMGKGNKGCQCENCKPIQDKYGYSGLQIRFVNELAEEINKWSQETLGRRIFVACWAYGISEAAPATRNGVGKWGPIDESVKANENVVIYYAPINADRSYALLDERQRVDVYNSVAQWKSVAENFLIWQYEVAFPCYFVYYPRIQTYSDDIHLYSEMGAQYVMMQSSWDGYNYWGSLMGCYVAAKMMWNPDLDANALKEEWISLYYGMAADTVSEIVRQYEELWFEDGALQFDQYMSNCEEVLAQKMSRNILKFGDMLEIAIAEIQSSNLTENEKRTYIKRVQAVRVSFLWLELDQYEMYHNTSLNGRYELATEVFDLLEQLGIDRASETGTLDGFKAEYLG